MRLCDEVATLQPTQYFSGVGDGVWASSRRAAMYEGDIAANLDHTFGYGGGHVASPARGRVLYEAGAVLVDAPMSGVGRQRTFSHSPYASASCFEVHPKTE